MSKQIKYFTPDSFDGERELKQHIFKPKGYIKYGSYVEGNVSLCGQIVLKDANYEHIKILRIKNEPVNESNLCKKCFKINLKNES